MKSFMGVYSWLSIATSGIRFGPDREAVKAELRQHIEDKAAGLMRSFPDMKKLEAEEMALNSMGDAWELKQELARVHTPWLGWLWRCTQVLVWGMLALTLVTVVDGGLDSLSWQVREAREARAVGRALYEDGEPTWEGEQLAVLQVDEEARLGGSVVSVSKASRWREPEGECVYLRLRITWDRPWEANQGAISSLWAEDDLGNIYETNTARSLQDGWNWCQRDMVLEGVPLEAGELRIHSQLREGLDLAVDLTREVAP